MPNRPSFGTIWIADSERDKAERAGWRVVQLGCFERTNMVLVTR